MKILRLSVATVSICTAVFVFSAIMSGCTNTSHPTEINTNVDSIADTEKAQSKTEATDFPQMIEVKEDSIADVYGSKFTIVRGEFADDETIAAAVKLRKAIKALTGNELKITTDFEKESAGIVRSERELLVGVTNRDESTAAFASLGAKDYIIDFRTTRVSILGGSGEATMAAVDRFIEDYFDEEYKAVRIAELTFYKYTHVYPVITVDGEYLDGFSIVCDDGMTESAEKLRDIILDETNKDIPIVEKKENSKCIRIVIDESLDPCLCRVYVEDGDLVLASSAARGIEKCIELFKDELETCGSESRNFDKNFEITGEYTVQSITEMNAATKHFIGNTDKNPLEYAVGEEMTFKIGLYADETLASCPKFVWSVAGDDGEKSSGTADGKSGELILKASCKVAGCVRVTVKACDENGKQLEGVDVFDGGATADFDKIVLGKEEPDDFDAFWKRQLGKLYTIAPKVVESNKVKTDRVGFEVYDVKIDAGDAGMVSGYVSVPVGAEPRSLKIRATFMGYGVNTARIVCLDDCITFAVNAHSIVNGETDAFYENLRATTLASYGFKSDENSDPEKVYFKNMILRDVQALRYLMQSDYWNGIDAEVSGGSQGAFQSIAVAGLMNDKISRLTASIPWICDLGGITVGRMRGWRPDYTDAIRYFDTANFAKRVKCTAILDAGLGDYICPPSGVTAMYNAMNCPKKITFWQNRTHGYTPKVKITFEKTNISE